MINGLLGKKLGMTQIFKEGEQVPVTVIKAGTCFVTQKKTSDKDGYDAVQLGFDEKKAGRTNKPMSGHFKKTGSPTLYHMVEFRGDELDSYEPGQAINCADVFKVGDFVDIAGRSKGKGFAGVMKKWNFRGGPASHGSMHGRGPGSIGQSSDPSRVFKGIKMPGHMGSATVTIQNLKVMDIKPEENLILVKGAVPGANGTIMVIKKALKKSS